MTGPAGSSVQTMTSQGNVLVAAFAGNTALAGTFAASTLSLGANGTGGLLSVASGSLSDGTLDISSGSMLASGTGSALSVSGQLSVGDAASDGAVCNLDATSGAHIKAGSLLLGSSGAAIYVDPVSVLEIGTAGGATPGALTVDSGADLVGQGDANAYGTLVNNGTIMASGGVLTVGAVSGQGTLEITAGAALVLNGATGPGQTILFGGANTTLGIATEYDAPQDFIAWFTPGDAIDMLGSPISAATYQATGTDIGVLTLWYGSQVADTMTLAGDYSGEVFLTAGDGGLGTLITVAPLSKGNGGASKGTTTPDQYQWVGSTSGNWNVRTNWEDVTKNANPAAIAPGVNDLVTIDAAGSGSFVVITGPANAATLSLTGDVALAGTFAIGTLTVGDGPDYIAATLDLLPGTVLTTPDAAIAYGEISVSGSAVLSVAGTMVLGGGESGVGLPTTQLSVTAGGTVTAYGLTLGGGSGDTITTDPTGVIEIGTAGGATAGAVTIDAGATLSGNGSVNPYGAVVDNGTVSALGGILTVGAVTGGGVLDIGAGAGLAINSSDAMNIAFTGASGVLLLADELVSLSGTIAGYVAGDAIDIQNDPITATSASASGNNTILSLYYGQTVVNRLTLAGSYAGEHFVLVPDGLGGTDVLVTGGGGGGGGNGQGNTDFLSWANPVSGAWGRAANWFDVTTNAPALAAPGAQNTVQITGPGGAGFQSIGGPGLCANLSFFGNSLLSRAFITGTLTIGGTLSGALTAAVVDVTNSGASSSLTATAQAIIDDGTLVVGSGGVLSIGCVLAVGDGTPGDNAAYSDLSVTSSGTATLAGLSLGGGAGADVQTDATGVIEVGDVGGAAAGAVTIDTGIAVSGSGVVNVGGLVVVNGMLTAAGGTLAVGAVSGAGSLAIATEATLALNGADIVPIAFAGAGATLLLQGSEEDPAAAINGFTQGDAIVTGSSQVTSVQYAPGAGNLGTLTLYDGSQVAGTLLLGGDFAGDNFTLQPDGAGTEIGVQQSGGGGASQGTSTPDDYTWLGGNGTGWNTAANWEDVSAGQNPAQIAPGAHDLDTVQGGGGSNYTTIVGPANADALTLFGNVALAGAYAVGTLQVGAAGKAGILALGAGAGMQTAFTTVFGDLILAGGNVSSAGLLTLDGGGLVAGHSAAVLAGTLALSGSGAVVTVDATSSVEIGAGGNATEGAFTVDAAAVAGGAGALDPTGTLIDNGTITAAGGTLLVGAVAGGGTLLVGAGATMALESTAVSGLLIDFAGAGTLDVTGALPAADIADFGDGDQILVPLSGVTNADYAATGANTGVLSLLAGDSVLATLTLVGVGAGQSFAVAANGAGTTITTQTTDWGGGGGNVGNSNPGSSGGTLATVESEPWFATLPSVAQETLHNGEYTLGNGIAWIDTSANGSHFDQLGGAYGVAVVNSPNPGGLVGLPEGYSALVALGVNPTGLTSGGASDALIVGNNGNDTISGTGINDTLVGGSGDTEFFTNSSNQIVGGGNDTIITGQGDCQITTAEQSHSIVWLGVAHNSVVSQGSDTILAVPGPGANDTIRAIGGASDLIFSANVGQTSVITGDGPSAIIDGGGTTLVYGGAGNGGVMFANSATLAEFSGGAGSAVIVGGSGELSVQGGAGALTVFGGTGNTIIQGAAGPSFYLVGDGASTVSAASGNHVWLVGNANDSLIAGGGNIILNGANSAGDNVLQAGSGPCTMLGGFGQDTLLGGAGNAVMVAGSGADVFSFINGSAGGSATLLNFNAAADSIILHGYGSYNANLVDGSEVIALSDGTQIELAGITAMTGVHINLA